MRRSTPAYCLVLALSPFAAADVLQVPGDSPTIQGAINMAVDGDEIVVAPGTYYELVDFKGKAVIVRSSDGAATTIIDGDDVRRGVHAHLGESTSTVLEGFTITNCFATTNGAGVLIRAGSSPTIRHCVIKENETLKSGGGVAIRDASSPIIEDCTIENNLGRRFGGGVFVQASSPTLSDTLIAGNDVMHQAGEPVGEDSYMGGGLASISGSGTVLNDCTFRQNRAHVGGGGVYSRDSAPVLNSCVLEQNRVVHDVAIVPFTAGGGLWNDDGSDATLVGCLLSANHAVHAGGGAANTSGSNMTLDDTRLIDNLAKDAASKGGGVYNDASTLTMRLCDVERNRAGHGGGVMSVSGTAVLDVTDLVGNEATHPDGRGGGMANEASTLTVLEATIKGNEAARGGGLACVAGGVVSIDGSEFAGNRASQGGGGVYNHMTSPLVDGCNFTANEVSAEGVPVPGLGGGMWNANESSPTITDCDFTSNQSSVHGGGMANTDDSAPTVEDAVFTGNMATAFNSLGGGMYNRNASPAVNVCRFEGNSAAVGGGMANIDDASPTLTACTIVTNTAMQVGGGVFNTGSSNPAIQGGEITGNVSTLGGGGLASTEDSMPRLTRARVCLNLPDNIMGAFDDIITPEGGNDICGILPPPPPPPPVPGDVNGDGEVTVDDLIAVIAAWGSDDAAADLNNDGIVDVDDLTEVLLNW